MSSKITVFTGSCHLCDEAVALVRDVCGDSVDVKSIDGPEAREMGLTSVPTIVKDGEVVFTRLPSRQEVEESLLS